MNLETIMIQMTHQAETIHNLMQGVSDEQARWKPSPESWSIIEVINHLADEEREDFRLRLDYILHHPGEEWPPIDPRNWVTQRQYAERVLKASTANFLAEREKSLAWLAKLGSPNWDTEAVTRFGTMRAGDMLSAWVGHDLLHLRQLVELHWGYLNYSMQPYHTQYAGDW